MLGFNFTSLFTGHLRVLSKWKKKTKRWIHWPITGLLKPSILGLPNFKTKLNGHITRVAWILLLSASGWYVRSSNPTLLLNPNLCWLSSLNHKKKQGYTFGTIRTFPNERNSHIFRCRESRFSENGTRLDRQRNTQRSSNCRVISITKGC